MTAADLFATIRDIESRLRSAERGERDAEDVLRAAGELTQALVGASGECAGVAWYDVAGFSWWTWGHRLRAVVNDWVRAGRLLDRKRLKELKVQAKPLFALARAALEACLS